MWQGFKKYLFFALLLLPFVGLSQTNNGLIYNLKQNWVQYDMEAQSFMPAISQSAGRAISFSLNGEEFQAQRLYIQNSKTAYLFYNQTLLRELRVGSHYFEIDSLVKNVGSKHPLITLYGKDVKSELTTLIVDNSFVPFNSKTGSAHKRDKNFTSFFILISILLLGSLIFIKLNSYDFFSQYTNVSRAFNFTTIDEIIYKGGFFLNPSVQLIAWMSFSSSFVFYYLITSLNIHFLEVNWISKYSILFHIVQLAILAVGFFSLYIVRYVLIRVMASVFDMSSIRNIHFATYLRLTFYLLLVLQMLVTLSYFVVIPFTPLLIVAISISALFAIIVLIGIRLSFIIRHPFVQIFLYLCGTEIFLFVFVFMLVVG